ncbi:MAG: PAS domain-containing protein [Planctomycetota bacterium]
MSPSANNPPWPVATPPMPNEPGVLACRFAPDTTLTEVSDAYCEAFNKSREALIGRPFLELVPGSEHEAIRAKLAALTPRNPSQTYHHPVLRPDGSQGVQQWIDRAIFDDAGKPLGYESIGRDISTLEQTQAALHESEERFRLIAENLREVFWVMDPLKQRVKYISPAVVDVLGLSPVEVYEDPAVWLESVHPDDRAEVEAAMLRVHEQDFDLTYRVNTDQGSTRYVRSRGYPVGRNTAVGTLADVTVEHQSFEVARLNEERFRALMDGSLDAIYLFRSVRDDKNEIIDFEFIDINRRGADLVTRTPEQVIGQRLCELLPVNRTNGYFEEYRQVTQTRRPFIDEIRVDAEDASDQGIRATWMQRQVIPLDDGVAIFVRDITQRKRDELEIAELYRQTQTILDAVPSFIFYKDAHNRILRVNRAAAESIGKPVQEIEGRNTEEFFPEDAAAFYKDDVEVMRSRKPKLGYIETYEAVGQAKRYIRTDKVPMFGDDGDPVGILGVATDVTERRRAEIERNELELAIEERRVIGQELHDGIGQQLTGLRMLIESARKTNAKGGGVEQTTLDELAGIIAHATGEVRRLIDGLMPERIAPADLGGSLRKLADRLAQQHALETNVEIDAPVGALVAALNDDQADHLRMIAHEAAHNAAKHARASRLSISLVCDNEAIGLEVRDDGRGIPENPESAHGSGKGLTIMRHRADMIDASLSVFRNHRGGTTVRCVKPLE